MIDSQRFCRTGFQPWMCCWFVVLLFALSLPGLAASGEVIVNPNRVKAAFLRNFARYVTWPTSAFANDHSPWRICILGDDPFGDVLDKTLTDRTEQGRSFEILRTEAVSELARCQIVFVAYKDATRRRAILAELKKLPILTVSDAPEFLQEGGVVQFQVGDQVEMHINLDQSRSASLTIQTKMLEVSRDVVENGTVKKWR